MQNENFICELDHKHDLERGGEAKGKLNFDSDIYRFISYN